MVFQKDGSFSYYIAYNYGNSSYVLEEDGVLINLTELDLRECVRKLLLTEAGKVRLGMERDFFWTFWIKNNRLILSSEPVINEKDEKVIEIVIKIIHLQ